MCQISDGPKFALKTNNLDYSRFSYSKSAETSFILLHQGVNRKHYSS